MEKNNYNRIIWGVIDKISFEVNTENVIVNGVIMSIEDVDKITNEKLRSLLSYHVIKKSKS